MIKLIHGDSLKTDIPAVDMIFTDPPFEMSGKDLAGLFDKFDYKHLVLICSMHQALEFVKHADLEFGFDLVVSHISPKKAVVTPCRICCIVIFCISESVA